MRLCMILMSIGAVSKEREIDEDGSTRDGNGGINIQAEEVEIEMFIHDYSVYKQQWPVDQY